ncbi:MAG: SH3 domain-containing protein [Chloroflexaceae bacterium]
MDNRETGSPSPDSNTPAELIATGRDKFALSQARLRQRQTELALLSLLGSLEDVLRAHLLLHQQTAATDWFKLLEALCVDAAQPLSRDEVARLYRMHRLRTRIVRGESVTLTYDTIVQYQQFVAELLARYGVVVIPPESVPNSLLPQHFPNLSGSKPAFWRRYRVHLAPSLMIVLIFLIGATATVFLQQARSNQPAAVVPPTMTVNVQISTTGPDPAAPPDVAPTPTAPPVDGLTPGRTAFVRPDISGGLALRAAPSSNPDVPIQTYLSGNTAVRVLDGPIEADGYTWWQVRTANQEGWCAGEFLEVR